MERGDPVLVRGERGSFRFIEHVKRPSGAEWVTVYGGSSDPNGVRCFRSFTPERVRPHPNPPQERRR